MEQLDLDAIEREAHAAKLRDIEKGGYTAHVGFCSKAKFHYVPALVKRVRELEEELRKAEVRLIDEESRAKSEVNAEREACAKILEDAARFPGLMGQTEIGMLQQLASAIRARGKTKQP